MNQSKQARRAPADALIEKILFLPGCVALTWLLLVVPQHRNLGLFFRSKLYVLPGLFVLAWVAGVCRNGRVRFLLYLGLFGAFLLPLTGLWNSGNSDQYIFAGSIPFSDAFIHQNSTLRLMYGGSMGQSSAVRPIAFLFYSFILRLSGNNFYILYAVVAILIAWVTLATTRLISGRLGAIVGAFFYVSVFFFVRRLLGTFMSEPFSLALGVISCYLLLRGIFDEQDGTLIIGFGALSLALSVRPGSMGVLATVGLWFYFVWLRRGDRAAFSERKRILLAALALGLMLVPFALNAWLGRLVYEPGKLLTNNQAAEFIYGLCLGGETAYHAMFRTELTQYFGTEEFMSGLVGLCVNEIRANPGNIALSLERILVGAFFDVERGLFSYFDGARGELVSIFRYILQGMWFIGIVRLICHRKSNLDSFLLAATLGELMSLLVLPTFGIYRLRYASATVWIASLVVGVLLEDVLRRAWAKFGKPDWNVSPSVSRDGGGVRRMMIGLLTGIVLIVIIMPLRIRAVPSELSSKSTRICADGREPARLIVAPGNAVFLHHYDLTTVHAPNYWLNYVRPGLHDTSALELFPYTDQWEKPIAVLSGFEPAAGREMTVFAPLTLMSEADGFGGLTGEVAVCGDVLDPAPYRSYRYVEADEVWRME